jgi:hypothetical protein
MPRIPKYAHLHSERDAISGRWLPGTNPKPPKEQRKNGAGAPPKNQNALKFGTWLLVKNRAKPLGDKASRAKRLSGAVTYSLMDSLGGEDGLSQQQKILCAILGAQVARLDRLHRAYRLNVKRREYQLKRNPKALAAIDACLRPLEGEITKNLGILGLKKVIRAKNISEIFEDEAPQAPSDNNAAAPSEESNAASDNPEAESIEGDASGKIAASESEGAKIEAQPLDDTSESDKDS